MLFGMVKACLCTNNFLLLRKLKECFLLIIGSNRMRNSHLEIGCAVNHCWFMDLNYKYMASSMLFLVDVILDMFCILSLCHPLNLLYRNWNVFTSFSTIIFYSTISVKFSLLHVHYYSSCHCQLIKCQHFTHTHTLQHSSWYCLTIGSIQ